MLVQAVKKKINMLIEIHRHLKEIWGPQGENFTGFNLRFEVRLEMNSNHCASLRPRAFLDEVKGVAEGFLYDSDLIKAVSMLQVPLSGTFSVIDRAFQILVQRPELLVGDNDTFGSEILKWYIDCIPCLHCITPSGRLLSAIKLPMTLDTLELVMQTYGGMTEDDIISMIIMLDSNV
eukprot:813510-Rhodomonas_salina.1